jgi:hypothetical protein
MLWVSCSPPLLLSTSCTIPLFTLFLGRIPFYITSWLAGIGTNTQLLNIFEQQRPSYEGVYLLVVC